MKKAKNEHIIGTVTCYLKKRQFTTESTDHTPSVTCKRSLNNSDHHHQPSVKLCGLQSVQEMTLQGAMNCESGVRNAIGFSSVNRDVTAIDQQFTRFKTFVSEAVEPYKSELTHLLFPVFVHLYLELITNGQKTPAHKFRCRHQGLFADVAEYKATVESLAAVQSSQDLSRYPNIKSFRENKYMVTLSEDVVGYLTRYLTGNNHLILLQILNLHIEVKVQDAERNALHLYDDQAMVDGGSGVDLQMPTTNREISAKSMMTTSASADLKVNCESGVTDSTNSSAVEKLELKSLENAIHVVKNGPPSLPSICLYTFTNTFQGLSSVCLSSDVSWMAAGFEDSAIRLWNLMPDDDSGDLERVCNHECDGANISTFQLACDIDARRSRAKIANDRRRHLGDDTVVKVSSSEMKTMRAHSGQVYGVCFVPNTRLLISCSEDTTVRAWNTDCHSNLALYRGHNYPVWDVDCSSLGSYFATASQDRTSKLWYLDRAYPVRIFAGHTLDVDCVKFHPNANYVATGSSDKSVRLWNIQDGRMVRMFQGHRGTVFALAFSPNGQLLASAGEDRRIRIWDLGAGTMMKELRGHIDTVYSLCFSRDSSSLASGGLDGTIRLWDVRKGISAGNQIDNHTSPELLGSYPAKSVGIPLLHYSFHNLLMAAGTRFT